MLIFFVIKTAPFPSAVWHLTNCFHYFDDQTAIPWLASILPLYRCQVRGNRRGVLLTQSLSSVIISKSWYVVMVIEILSYHDSHFMYFIQNTKISKPLKKSHLDYFGTNDRIAVGHYSGGWVATTCSQRKATPVFNKLICVVC